MPIYPTNQPNENSSCDIEFQIVDPKTKEGIPVSTIATATYTLRNRVTGLVINTRTDIDFTPYVDNYGITSIPLLAEDNPIIDDTLTEEVHIMTVTIVTTTDPVITLVEEIWIRVDNFETVS